MVGIKVLLPLNVVTVRKALPALSVNVRYERSPSLSLICGCLDVSENKVKSAGCLLYCQLQLFKVITLACLYCRYCHANYHMIS